jgi:hypothetical protein
LSPARTRSIQMMPRNALSRWTSMKDIQGTGGMAGRSLHCGDGHG